MKIQIKFNKTALREFQKKLQIREKALPTLKNKGDVGEMNVDEVTSEIKPYIDKLNNIYGL